MYATFHCRACESFSTKTPDGRPYRLTHKYTATLTEVEMSRLRQEVTSEYKRRDGKYFASESSICQNNEYEQEMLRPQNNTRMR